MRLVAGFWLAVACVFAVAPVAADQGPYPKTEAEIQAAYDALQWHSGPGSYKLPASHAVIQLPLDRALLLGADAERYSWLASGTEFPRDRGGADLRFRQCRGLLRVARRRLHR